MARIIDKKINKEIDSGLGLNYATGVEQNGYELPSFKLNERGEYEYAGTQVIHSLGEYTEYMKKYSAIANYIKQHYSSVISRIYKNSLNSLIASKGRYNLNKNKYSLLSKTEKTFGISNISTETTQNYENMLNYVTKAAYKTRRLKPNTQIVSILQNAEHSFTDRDRFYVLPQINDNGVVLKQKKNNSNMLEAQFELVSEADAKAIENYMLETANSLDRKTAESVKSQIVKVFNSAKKAGNNMKDGVNSSMINELTELTANLVDLVGVDLSSFEKKARGNSLEHTEQTTVDPTGQTEVSSKNPVNEVEHVNSANEILIRGIYKASPAVEGDVLVTKITPDGSKFSITFDGNKLFVSTSNEKQDEVDGPQMM
ncbi:MAG: hypothetical protein IJX17_04535 [Clostridia bacterium]|nr:hypothetical protein [Clostridia bacterium]